MTTKLTISQGYRQAQASKVKKPCLDYPYLGIPDEDVENVLPDVCRT